MVISSHGYLVIVVGGGGDGGSGGVDAFGGYICIMLSVFHAALSTFKFFLLFSLPVL